MAERAPQVKRASDEKPTLYSINSQRIGAPAEEQIAHIAREVNRIFAMLSTAIAEIRTELAKKQDTISK
jgi:hypothetical protein